MKPYQLLGSAVFVACSSPGGDFPSESSSSGPGSHSTPAASEPASAEAPLGGAPLDGPVLIDSAPSPANTTDSSDNVTQENACDAISSRAEAMRVPTDVIVLIDNSDSMLDMIDAVERNINVNLANILEQDHVDARVIMVSGYRQDGVVVSEFSHRVCVGPPLGPGVCEGRPTENLPHNDPRFFHYDQPMASSNGPCRLLSGLHLPPQPSHQTMWNPTFADDPLVQQGIEPLLRSEAVKSIIMISDDTVSCGPSRFAYEGWLGFPWEERNTPFSFEQRSASAQETATNFDRLLRELAPNQFGPPDGERRYTWHSIVGVAPNATGTVYEAVEPLIAEKCDRAVNSGMPHQAISQLTGGLRFPVCDHASYDDLFRRIAVQVEQSTRLPCNWSLPPAPEGMAFDRDRVNLSYQPGDGSPSPDLGKVDSEAECGAGNGWFYDNPDNPTAIRACPAVCDQLKADVSGEVTVLLGCETVQLVPEAR